MGVWSGQNRSGNGDFSLWTLSWMTIFWVFCGVSGASCGVLLSLVLHSPSLKPLDDYRGPNWELPTTLYSRSGKVVSRLYTKQRSLVPIEKIPPKLIQAIITVEDRRFFEHSGLDFYSIARAAWNNLRAGRIVEGGSTITQQLSRVLFLTRRKTFRRKFREAYLALRIERRYTKRQILERYLNKIYFGSGAYGVEAASQVYFNHSVRSLNWAEAALLAGLPRGPSRYSPYRHPRLARRRHRTVMNLLVRLGQVRPSTIQPQFQAFWENIKDRAPRDQDSHGTGHQAAPYFVKTVRNRLLDLYSPRRVYGGGLEVHTTLDLSVQVQLRDRLRDYLRNLNDRLGHALPDTAVREPFPVEGAVYVRKVRNGDVLAVVGGHRWSLENQFNRALQAHRQPGSAFKPIVYSAALSRGWTVTDTLADKPVYYVTGQGRWIPRNYSRTYHGEVPLFQALVHSWNVATVDLAREVGSRAIIQHAQKLGIDSPLYAHPSLALGGLRNGVTLADLSDVYSVFANQGLRSSRRFIRVIRDRGGNRIYTARPRTKRVLSKPVAGLMRWMLRMVVERGTGQTVAAQFSQPMAGKTGTTSHYRDAWFIGFSPRWVMGSWFGYDDGNRSLGPGMTGARVAGQFWKQAARVLVDEVRTGRQFPVIPQLNYYRMDPHRADRTPSNCPTGLEIPYRPGHQPLGECRPAIGVSRVAGRW